MSGAKLLLRWDIRPESEQEYFEFLVNEFIPSLNQLGIEEIQVWYTAYGDCEQKLAEGTTETTDDMFKALRSSEWRTLNEKLQQFVANYHSKVVRATRGFQL
jgi:hypothetical protein